MLLLLLLRSVLNSQLARSTGIGGNFFFSNYLNFAKFIFTLGRYLKCCISIKKQKHTQFTIMKVWISAHLKVSTQKLWVKHKLLGGRQRCVHHLEYKYVVSSGLSFSSLFLPSEMWRRIVQAILGTYVEASTGFFSYRFKNVFHIGSVVRGLPLGADGNLEQHFLPVCTVAALFFLSQSSFRLD